MGENYQILTVSNKKLYYKSLKSHTINILFWTYQTYLKETLHFFQKIILQNCIFYRCDWRIIIFALGIKFTNIAGIRSNK
jgi:hypothetical protein